MGRPLSTVASNESSRSKGKWPIGHWWSCSNGKSKGKLGRAKKAYAVDGASRDGE